MKKRDKKITAVYTVMIFWAVIYSLPLHANAQNERNLLLTDLRVEYFTNPIGIDALKPRLSWKIHSSARNTVQSAYQIQVSLDPDFSAILWDSESQESDQSVHIQYNGPELESRSRYYWRTRIWDNYGNQSGWSEPAFWEMGLIDTSDWQVEWIEPGFEQDSSTSPPSPMFRYEFELNGEVVSARAYVTSHGIYQMEINGNKVGDQLFAPGWTSYLNRLQYQTYDITGLLKYGENAIGVMVGDGWFRGYLGWGDTRNLYGETLALLTQIEVMYKDGSKDVFGTNEQWKVTTGPVLKSDIYNGEKYDARLEKTGWSLAGYDDSDWPEVSLADHGKKHLVASEGPPIRKIQTLKPLDILQTPDGDTVVDFGQNLVGWVKIRAEGSRGTEIVLQHAEVLDRDGNFYTENIRAADQTNTYILKGEGIEIWEPVFSFQGFRYVKVEGYPGELTKNDLTAVVIHSDMEPTGHFQSSNALINQLQHNIVWGQKGNFLDIPTDCPQRDERLGWTGDIQVFATTSCLNMDVSGFLTKWMRDVEADQNEDGSVPFVVPNVLGEQAAGASGWADASVIVPWVLYQEYGDKQILETQYESMKAWVNYMRNRAALNQTTYLWDTNFTFGDWLSFNSTASDYPGAYTDKNLISTAFFAYSTDLLIRSAKVLGYNDDVEEYSGLLENIKEAFRNEYLTSSGRLMSNTQTAYLLALRFDLLPEEMNEIAAEHLVSVINERGHLTTGFLGTPHLNPILSQYGYQDNAFDLLMRKEYPSWLYPVTMGATTIWERWDGIRPDGTFQDPGMNSFNHYAYGAIGEWLYKSVAGINHSNPGYKELSINPLIGGNLSHARAMLNTMYGRTESSWNLDPDTFTFIVEIPANTSAIIFLPGAEIETITESEVPITQEISGIENVLQHRDGVEVKTGSGRYYFSYPAGELASRLEGVEFDLSTPIGTLAALIANPGSRKILNRQLPDLMNSPWLSQVMGFTLEYANEALPDHLKLNQSVIDQVLSEINDLYQP